MPRIALLKEWLNHVPSALHLSAKSALEPASADASFRRYFRTFAATGKSYIVMDAPPTHEDCRPFIKIAKLFKEAGVHVPTLFAENLKDGFLLLSDLGNSTYLSVLNTETAHALYGDANRALITLQKASRANVLPEYDQPLLQRELALFPDWYISQHVKRTLDATQQATLQTAFTVILQAVLAQPKVYVHRDYHTRNLMHMAAEFPHNPGIIDFQDAVYGPITYDLVSLYRDAYIAWQEDDELDFVIRYWDDARRANLPVGDDFHDFYRAYEWMGVQRQLKVLGIFARLCYRDGKSAYLNDMPRVLHYLRRTCERYRELRPLARLLDELVA